jgi:hypothetical protein
MRDTVLVHPAEPEKVNTVRVQSLVVVATRRDCHGLQGGSERSAREERREPAKRDVVREAAWPPAHPLTEGADEKSQLRDFYENWSLCGHSARVGLS